MSESLQPRLIRGKVGVDITVRSRVEDSDFSVIFASAISKCYLQIFNKAGSNVHNTEVTVSDVFETSLQTDWTADNTGYSFKATIPGTVLTDENEIYNAYFWCVPVAGGSDFPIWYQVSLTPIQKEDYPA